MFQQRPLMMYHCIEESNQTPYGLQTTDVKYIYDIWGLHKYRNYTNLKYSCTLKDLIAWIYLVHYYLINCDSADNIIKQKLLSFLSFDVRSVIAHVKIPTKLQLYNYLLHKIQSSTSGEYEKFAGMTTTLLKKSTSNLSSSKNRKLIKISSEKNSTSNFASKKVLSKSSK